MAEYIERQAALDAIQQHREDVLDSYEYDEGVAFVYAAAHNHIIDVIKLLPSADVAPVRHGHWIGGEIGKCSVCGHEGCASDIWNNIEIDGQTFCPACGAILDGEQG